MQPPFITNINKKYQESKLRKEEIGEELLSLNLNNSSGDAKVEKYKNDIKNIGNFIDEDNKPILTYKIISKIGNLFICEFIY